MSARKTYEMETVAGKVIVNTNHFHSARKAKRALMSIYDGLMDFNMVPVSQHGAYRE